MLPLVRIALVFLVAPARCDDTVADDISSHMMGRISELLSPEECQAFYAKLRAPEENVREELDRLSEKRNPIQARRRRDIISVEQCKDTLSHWLQTEGDTMYWDRLSRSLQAIGRPDVSVELGKNLNQDKNLEMKKNVEEYHKTVKHLTSSLLLEENERDLMSRKEEERSGQGRQRREGQDVRSKFKSGEWDELELIIEKKPLPPYGRSLFEWFTPVAAGVIGGFLTSFILGGLAIYSFFWILKEGSSGPVQPNGDTIPEMIFRAPPPRCGGIYYTYPWINQFGRCSCKPAVLDDDEYSDEEIEEKECLVRP
ncbi:hypothetical protein JRQ81_004023 [Phrynocephalus forsythii]|uniref:Death domain-containing protein n=1 Tax=Phrynocephalus forsythii TaxID=171643 RepID=A0A9Q0XLS9_9SAUR|nr:hypothetical protein JRQ81_004023 [Phrynocephalus forsythii]